VRIESTREFLLVVASRRQLALGCGQRLLKTFEFCIGLL
jgi:hypothetical protein